jgi:hypothetical protein
MGKIQEKSNQFTVTIPLSIIRLGSYKKGDEVAISYNERGNIEVQKVKNGKSS